MAIRERGGMWCPSCKKPVAARKNGHAVRNTGGILGAVPTLGLSLVATKSERWHCPICGGPVKYGGRGRVPRSEDELPATGPVTVTLVDYGRRKIQAIKVYRRVTGAGLREAVAAVEAGPAMVGSFEASEAEALVGEFETLGCVATAELLTEPAEPAVDSGIAAELRELSEMHAAGVLSADEFAAAKARVLG